MNEVTEGSGDLAGNVVLAGIEIKKNLVLVYNSGTGFAGNDYQDKHIELVRRYQAAEAELENFIYNR